ncbi:MAG: 7-carboxy-7-deazaguanine synthase QueE [Prevotellaceae bacterium]|nr:7-carboxy-7-deazaguanine synthase QueE [Prevotellaceae bacterium]
MMRVNEIFHSLQGEGRFTGTPAVFVRLSGCNLNCWFCDTEFHSFKEMTEDEIVAEALKYPSRHVVITGGEPTLQLTASLTDKLHAEGFFIMLETNGTNPLPEGCEIDWITCSPKLQGPSPSPIHPLHIQRIDELKVVYEGHCQDMSVYDDIIASEYRLQPGSTGDKQKDTFITSQTIEYILAHPKWNLSLQTHKILGVR